MWTRPAQRPVRGGRFTAGGHGSGVVGAHPPHRHGGVFTGSAAVGAGTAAAPVRSGTPSRSGPVRPQPVRGVGGPAVSRRLRFGARFPVRPPPFG